MEPSYTMVLLERSLPELKQTYRRAHITSVEEFDPLVGVFQIEQYYRNLEVGSRKHRIVQQNVRMGAAVDLCIRRLSRRLKRSWK